MNGSFQTVQLSVAVHTADVITRDSVETYLRGAGRITVLTGERQAEAEIALMVTKEVCEAVLAEMAEIAAARQDPDPMIVLVAERIGERHLMQAFGHGLVGFVPRSQASMPRIRQVLWDAHGGAAVLPGRHVRHLVQLVQTLQRDVLEPHGLGLAGLSAREVEVLQLLSRGLNTYQVARQLNYSERTIKNILAGMMERLNLRNRSHAVAYALQTGAI